MSAGRTSGPGISTSGALALSAFGAGLATGAFGAGALAGGALGAGLASAAKLAGASAKVAAARAMQERRINGELREKKGSGDRLRWLPGTDSIRIPDHGTHRAGSKSCLPASL